MHGASPGKSIPVSSLNPNALKYLIKFSCPNFNPMVTNAGLHECTSASSKLMWPCPSGLQQLIDLSPTVIYPGQ